MFSIENLSQVSLMSVREEKRNEQKRKNKHEIEIEKTLTLTETLTLMERSFNTKDKDVIKSAYE